MAAAVSQARLAQDIVPSGQLVTFTLDGVEFGLDIDRVQEITPRPDITPVPGAPSFVLGVLNLRGQIIPVLDSRLRFHLPPQETTPRTRIIILNLAGQPTGLQVDSVAEVVRLEDMALRETPPLVAGVRSDYLAGMVTVGKRLITLIDLDKILDSSEFAQRELLLESNSSAPVFGAGNLDDQMEEVDDEVPYVTFQLGSESFGINLQMVEEILELPPVTKVPDAPDFVMGVICLRDQVLPLLDFIRLLKVEEGSANAARDMVILLTLGSAKLGIAVDGIQEIIRIRPDQMLPPPQTLSEAEAGRLEGVVVREDRMVSLIKVMDIIAGEDQERIAALGGAISEAQETEQVVTHELPLVVFKLGQEAYALQLFEVREIIMVGMITPVPRAPAFIEGVLNLRGEVMPVMDLRTRFGLERHETTSLSRIIITPIGGVFTGLVVDAVDEVMGVDERRLEGPPKVTTGGANAYIHKVARTERGVVFLLDIQRLLTDVEGQQLEAFRGKKG